MATVDVVARVPPMSPAAGAGGLPLVDEAVASLGPAAPPGLAADVVAAADAAFAARGCGAELDELRRTWRSNGRPMVWARMAIAAGAEFALHCHPNVEVVYVVSGALREDRLRGPPPGRGAPFAPGRDATLDDDLSARTRADFDFFEWRAGATIVNEIGSVHRSYCAPEEGCDLLALWGGCHAKIARPPACFAPPAAPAGD